LKIFHNFDVKSKPMKKTLLLLAVFTLSTSAFSQIPNYVPSNGLVGWWPFNGNANDESGNGNNLAVKAGLPIQLMILDLN
jgi:hypothetical protein